MAYKDPVKRREAAARYRATHREEVIAKRKSPEAILAKHAYDEKNKDKILEIKRRYRLKHKDEIVEKQRIYRQTQPERWRGYYRKHYVKDVEKIKARQKKRVQRLRLAVLDGYGRRCACCGEGEERFLTIDHIDNDGKEHRKQVSPGASLYAWLIKKGFPKDRFQLLCFNCNCGRYHNGGVCPHKVAGNG